MDNGLIGAELSQLARLLFNSASNKFYSAVVIEALAGSLAAVLGILQLSDNMKLFGAAISTCMLLIAYGQRLRFDEQYDIAETMRRQSVFTEALGWKISRTQASEWRQRVGKHIRKQVKVNPRPKDYYSTQQKPGPGKLLEMTVEGIFYTRHLYKNVRFWVWCIGIGAILVSILVMSIALSSAIPTSVDLLVAQVIYAIIPIIITANLIGWGLKLNRLNESLKDIEASLESLTSKRSVDISQVIRLVSEYNCQVASGFPVHNRLYAVWVDEIEELWLKRQEES